MMARRGGVEELVVAPAAVDDLRRYRNQGKRRYEVRYLVVEWNGLEDVPRKTRPVQDDAEDDQPDNPTAWRPLPPPVFENSNLLLAYTPGSPYPYTFQPTNTPALSVTATVDGQGVSEIGLTLV